MYYNKVIEQSNYPNSSWKISKVGIFDKNDNLIHSYDRNYGNAGPFAYFKLGDREFFIIGQKYDRLTVIDAKDFSVGAVIGEGFCVYDCFVPSDTCYIPMTRDEMSKTTLTDGRFIDEVIYAPYLIARGCVWGDAFTTLVVWDINNIDKGQATVMEDLTEVIIDSSAPLEDIVKVDTFNCIDDTIFIEIPKLVSKELGLFIKSKETK